MPDLEEASLVQITLVHVELVGPRDERPVLEMRLRPDQQIVGFHNYWMIDGATRETVYHHANVWVATRL